MGSAAWQPTARRADGVVPLKSKGLRMRRADGGSPGQGRQRSESHLHWGGGSASLSFLTQIPGNTFPDSPRNNVQANILASSHDSVMLAHKMSLHSMGGKQPQGEAHQQSPDPGRGRNQNSLRVCGGGLALPTS